MKYALRDKKEMKDSGIEWVGSIPKTWNSLRLNSLFQQNKKKNERLVEDNLLSLSYGKIIPKDIDANEGLLPASFSTYQIVQPGFIVLRLTDLQNDKRSLRVGYVRERGIITSAYLGLNIIASGQHEDRYFYYLLHAYDLMKVFYNFGAGVRQSLNFNEFKKLDVIAPSISEQKRIAVFLDEKTAVIDEVVEKKKKQIELLKEKRAALITQAVTKGLNPNAKMKDSGVEWIGEIPEGWEVKKLKYVAPLKDKKCNFNSTYTYIGLENIVSGIGKLVESNEPYQPEGIVNIYNVGNVLFSKLRPYLAKAFLAESVGVCTGELLVMNPLKNKVTPEFLLYRVLSEDFIDSVNNSTYGSKMPRASWNYIGNLLIAWPPIDEQRKIAKALENQLSSIDKAIKIIKKSIHLIQEYRSSLISHAVTGKIVV